MIKALCQRCYMERYGVLGKWDKQDDEGWDCGVGCCPEEVFKGDSWESLDFRPPPASCKYHLEHLVLGQEREKT